MNIEDPETSDGADALERRLQETPLGLPPTAWRSEILARALAEATAPAASRSVRRVPTNDGSPGWLEWLPAWLRAVPAEWAAVAGLVLMVVGLNWPLSGGSGSGGSLARSSSHDARPVEGVIYMMASRESLLRELGLTDDLAPAQSVRPPAAPADKGPRRQLNRSGTNDVVSGWV